MYRFLLFFLCCMSAWAQKKNEAFQYHIFESKGPIKIDGLENDGAWQNIKIARFF